MKHYYHALALAAATLVAGSAHAVDWSGYFRAGPGATTTKGASRACYGLPGDGMKFRLGNECDIYGEFQLAQDFKADGIEYKAVLMTDFWNGAGDVNGDDSTHNRLRIEQLFVEAKGFDFAPGATFWVGKERGRRGDVHIVDTFFTQMRGVGGGVKGIGAGPGKLAVAFYGGDTDSADTAAARRVNVEYYDIAANPGGKLAFIGTLTDSDVGGKGTALSVRHTQDGLLGGGNSLWLQFAQGSAGLNSNYGNLAADSRTKSWRIADGFNWQLGAFGGQAFAMWAQQRSPDATTGAILKQTDTSVGGRISYALTKNFKLLAELGHSELKPEGQDTQKLTKFTFAPTLSTGPGFWNRPELRLYVTHAKWNAAAGNVTGKPAFDGKTSGTSYGAQVEIWY